MSAWQGNLPWKFGSSDQKTRLLPEWTAERIGEIEGEILELEGKIAALLKGFQR